VLRPASNLQNTVSGVRLMATGFSLLAEQETSSQQPEASKFRVYVFQCSDVSPFSTVI